MKTSKKLTNIIREINGYCNKHKGDVQFIGSFMAFEGKECNIVDDRIFAYGNKDTLQIDLKELLSQVNKERGEFVNW